MGGTGVPQVSPVLRDLGFSTVVPMSRKIGETWGIPVSFSLFRFLLCRRFFAAQVIALLHGFAELLALLWRHAPAAAAPVTPWSGAAVAAKAPEENPAQG